jgi:hypothetical protein
MDIKSSSRDPTKTIRSLDLMCHILLFMDSSSRNSVGALAGSWRTNSPLGLKMKRELTSPRFVFSTVPFSSGVWPFGCVIDTSLVVQAPTNCSRLNFCPVASEGPATQSTIINILFMSTATLMLITNKFVKTYVTSSWRVEKLTGVNTGR